MFKTVEGDCGTAHLGSCENPDWRTPCTTPHQDGESWPWCVNPLCSKYWTSCAYCQPFSPIEQKYSVWQRPYQRWGSHPSHVSNFAWIAFLVASKVTFMQGSMESSWKGKERWPLMILHKIMLVDYWQCFCYKHHKRWHLFRDSNKKIKDGFHSNWKEKSIPWRFETNH